MLLDESAVDPVAADIAEPPRRRHGGQGVEARKVLILGHLDPVGVVPDHHVIRVERAESLSVTRFDRADETVGNGVGAVHERNLATLLGRPGSRRPPDADLPSSGGRTVDLTGDLAPRR